MPLILNTGRRNEVPPIADELASLPFHRTISGYTPTPLIELRSLAVQLGLAKLWVKDESSRLGLPAFKILGASWATYRELRRRTGAGDEPVGSFDEIGERIAALGSLRLVAATEGNHGRAVARVAAWLDLPATILVPRETVGERIDAIRSEGADVLLVEGDYDDAVHRAREIAGQGGLLIQDTAWPGYERIPRWVVQGYTTMVQEIDRQLAQRGEAEPTLVLAQCGVGSFASAIVSHYRAAKGTSRPCIVSVEPVDAGCVQASVHAGRPTHVPGPHRSSMAGLNAGTVSSLAWPILGAGLDGALTIPDALAARAVRELVRGGVDSGISGAAGLAGLLALAEQAPETDAWRGLGLSGAERVLVFATEGVTDHRSHEQMLSGGGPTAC